MSINKMLEMIRLCVKKHDNVVMTSQSMWGGQYRVEMLRKKKERRKVHRAYECAERI